MSEPTTPTAPDAATQLQQALVPASALVEPGVAPVAPLEPDPAGNLPSPTGNDFNWLDPKPGEAPPVVPGAPATEVAKPSEPGAAPATAPAATESAWTPEKFISEKIGDPKTFLTDPKKIEQFAGLREVTNNALKANQALELENAQLKAGGAGALPEGAVLPETDAVKALQGELESYKTDAELWKQEQARRNLADSPSFRREHDAPRAGILRELNATAEEVEMTDKHVESFLSLGTEFKQAKWIEENVEDETAAELFKAKGAAFLGLTVQKNDALKAEDPIAELKNWQDREDAFGNQMAVKLSDNIAAEYQAAAVRVFNDLTGEEGDLYFATDAGKASLGEIQQRFANGEGYSPEEMVSALAAVDQRDTYQALSARFAEQIAMLTQENNKLKGLDPTANMIGQPTPPIVTGGAASEVDPFSIEEPKTLISSDDLANAMGQAGRR